jgi:hypothetical protein
MGAFHSGTDNSDELNWDGIHVTVGKVTGPSPEYAASIVLGGQRFEVSIEDLVEPAEEAFPQGWMDQVSKYTPPQPLAVAGKVTGFGRWYGQGGEE